MTSTSGAVDGTVSVVVGNPKPASRTLAAAVEVARRLSGHEPNHVLDLVGLGADLLDWTSARVADEVAAVTASELLVVASPTYKASYTGLLKLFLDRFPGGSLHRTTAVPLMLGGDLRHSLAPEAFLKPVLAELGASTPTRSLFLLDSEGTSSAAFEDWLAVAGPQLHVRQPA